ncbi:MAG: pilus assembly FimT family protein [Gemmatimonadaceae bacterium]
MRLTRRAAHTIAELVLALTLMGIMTAIAIPPLAAASARWRLRAAGGDVVNAITYAREAALARGVQSVVVIDGPAAEVRVTSGADTLFRRAIGALHGVQVAASGDSLRFAPDGLATGVSNLTVLLVLGTRVDSVVVSRLGRVRWGGR